MTYSSEKITYMGARTASVSTVIGISLVLFMLGSLGLILLNAKKLSDYVKENIQLQVFFKENISDNEALAIKSRIDQRQFVKRTEFINKEEAAKALEEDLGEDFISFLGFNPLSSSVNVYLKADYSGKQNVSKVVGELKEYPEVLDVVYSPDLIDQVNANINSIALIMLGFSALLLLISIALIHNTIRLAIYSKRFLIKTMKLVGATPGFIRRPFLWQGTLHGLYASFIAMALIAGALYFIRSKIPGFFEFKDLELYGKLFGGIVGLGIIIAWVSTYLAVRKYIRLKSVELY